MSPVSIEQAKSDLPELVSAALTGAEVFIVEAKGKLVQLVPVQKPPRTPQFGSGRGMIKIADDFGDPLDDFAAYM